VASAYGNVRAARRRFLAASPLCLIYT
jgi:hypothetical protein